MTRIFKYGLLLIALLLAIAVGAGVMGYVDARADADRLRKQADDLIAQGRGGADLGAEHLAILLKVEDPRFTTHSGVDFSTPGAGLTTITQSAAKRLAFDEFRPGFAKIRQTGYALGLESRLSKDQILALWLDTLEMGKGPNGWMTGFDRASEQIYGRRPVDLNNVEFIRLVAVLIAPSSYQLTRNDTGLDERAKRIERLLAGQCAPLGLTDVWLDECQANGK